MAKHSMLSTKDNPYDPFTQFDEWYAYDEMKGHHSCSVLGHFATTSSALSDEENQRITEEAIDRIIYLDNHLHNFIKVTKDIEDVYI